jgi:hypothetical protein
MVELRLAWVVEAARTGNIDMLHQILDLFHDHARDKDAGLIVSAYRTACEAGHVATVRDFLDRGLATASQDDTALLQAIENGNQGVIKLLLERGAPRETQNLWKTAINTTKTSVPCLTNFLIEEGFPLTLNEFNTITSVPNGVRYSSYRFTRDQKLALSAICEHSKKIWFPQA